MLSQQDSLTHVQVVANGDIAGAPASAGNLADLLSLDAEDAAGASATASSAVTALQDLLSGDLSGEVAAAGNPSQILLSHLPQASSVSDPLVLIDRCTTTRGFDSKSRVLARLSVCPVGSTSVQGSHHSTLSASALPDLEQPA